MRVVIIGRGRLATNLLPTLQKAGHEVVSVNSRTLEEMPEEADLYIISVKDSALQEVARLATKGREQSVFVHTAGSMPLHLFQGLTQHYGVFYPMQTFSKERLADFSKIPCFIEASDEHTALKLRKFTESVSQQVYELSTEKRKYLHLAAVFACNFTNHCYQLAAELLASQQIPFEVMLPLIDETAAKVHAMSPKDAQTGPAVRFDENVINRQIQLLDDDELLREVYQLMSRSIHQTATKK